MSASDAMAPAMSALSGRNGDDSSITHAAVSGQRVSLVAHNGGRKSGN